MNAKERFTPGPWSMSFDTNKNFIGGIGSIKNGRHVAEIERPYNSITGKLENTDESTANARLIAAAPDMLEALKRIIHHAENYSFKNDGSLNDGRMRATITAAAAAIKKALGE